MNIDSMNDDVANILKSEASTISDVNVMATAINGLVAIHDELLTEFDGHVRGEGNPKGLVLDDGMAQSSRLRVNGVIIRGVSDHVESAILAANRVTAESNSALCQLLPVGLPVRVASPAIIDGVSSGTCFRELSAPLMGGGAAVDLIPALTSAQKKITQRAYKSITSMI